MAPLEDIIAGSSIRGLWPDSLVTVLEVKWLGTVAIEVAFEGADGLSATIMAWSCNRHSQGSRHE
jgi:hypothetical protein